MLDAPAGEDVPERRAPCVWRSISWWNEMQNDRYYDTDPKTAPFSKRHPIFGGEH